MKTKLFVLVFFLITSLIAYFIMKSLIEVSTMNNVIEDKHIEDSVGMYDSTEEKPQDENQNFVRELEILEIPLYFFDESQNSLVVELRKLEIDLSRIDFFHIFSALARGPVTQTLSAVIPADTRILSISQIEDIITINLSEHFYDADDIIVARSALVNTLVSIPGINYVRILVSGEELTQYGRKGGEILGILKRTENHLGRLTVETDVISNVAEIRTLDWKLYFQDKNGELLFPEIRTIRVVNMEYAKAIVEEMILGPSELKAGIYRTIPSGARLLDLELVESAQPGNKDHLNLYFSSEFSQGLNESDYSLRTAIASLVMSLTSLSNVGSVSVIQPNGEHLSLPITDENKMVTVFKSNDFTGMIGRRIRIYFSDKNAMHLVPEYRVVSREDPRIARHILRELLNGPLYDDNLPVMPSDLLIEEIRIWVDEHIVYVDLPAKINLNEMGSAGETMAIYAIVNSLTDPINTRNIKQVQFLIDGKIVDGVGHLSLREPFMGNPALVHDK